MTDATLHSTGSAYDVWLAHPDTRVLQIAAIDGTRFDPPMVIEDLRPVTEVGESMWAKTPLEEARAAAEEYGIEIAAWTVDAEGKPKWMVGIQVAGSQDQTVEFAHYDRS